MSCSLSRLVGLSVISITVQCECKLSAMAPMLHLFQNAYTHNQVMQNLDGNFKYDGIFTWTGKIIDDIISIYSSSGCASRRSPVISEEG